VVAERGGKVTRMGLGDGIAVTRAGHPKCWEMLDIAG